MQLNESQGEQGKDGSVVGRYRRPFELEPDPDARPRHTVHELKEEDAWLRFSLGCKRLEERRGSRRPRKVFFKRISYFREHLDAELSHYARL